MTQVQENDSITLVRGESFTFTFKHVPTGRVGKLIARFFRPQGEVTITVVSLAITSGLPYVRLLVKEVTP